jgi:hypothetical protein
MMIGCLLNHLLVCRCNTKAFGSDLIAGSGIHKWYAITSFEYGDHTTQQNKASHRKQISTLHSILISNSLL